MIATQESDRSAEPEALRRGKAFHRRVQADWAGSVESALVRLEHGIHFTPPLVRPTRQRRGRLDVFIEQIEDFVTVIEIKSTD